MTTSASAGGGEGYLARPGEAAAEAEEQRGHARGDLARVPPLGQPERDRRGGRVARLRDVRDHDLALEAERLGERLDDPQVGLVGDEHLDVVEAQARAVHDVTRAVGGTGDRPLEHGTAVLLELHLWYLDPHGRRQLGLGAPRDRADAWGVGSLEHRGARAV